MEPDEVERPGGVELVRRVSSRAFIAPLGPEDEWRACLTRGVQGAPDN